VNTIQDKRKTIGKFSQMKANSELVRTDMINFFDILLKKHLVEHENSIRIRFAYQRI